MFRRCQEADLLGSWFCSRMGKVEGDGGLILFFSFLLWSMFLGPWNGAEFQEFLQWKQASFCCTKERSDVRMQQNESWVLELGGALKWTNPVVAERLLGVFLPVKVQWQVVSAWATLKQLELEEERWQFVQVELSSLHWLACNKVCLQRGWEKGHRQCQKESVA